jgi:hypothetical protein
MRGVMELRHVCLLQLALAAAWGCGGGAQATQGAQGAAGSASEGPGAPEGNAPSLVVPMSMVIPKKQVAPPPMTAPSFPQIPAGAAAGGVPGAGVTPGAGAMPGAGATPGGVPTTPGAAPGAPGAAAGTGTAPGAGAAGAPASGGTAAAGGAAPSGTAAGAETSGVAPDELTMLRDICVAEINMYRATVTTAMLTPLKRATAEQEECSQRGAKMDGDSMQAHGAARSGLCSSTGLSAEDTCPGWPVGGGGFGGGQYATIADALKGCLKSMWQEGDPSEGRDACIKDQSGCFQMHGHYLNMSDPNNSAVSCAFYKMSDGRSYWMNQDFAGNLGGWGQRK